MPDITLSKCVKRVCIDSVASVLARLYASMKQSNQDTRSAIYKTVLRRTTVIAAMFAIQRIHRRCTMLEGAFVFVVLTLLFVPNTSLAGTTRANIKLVNNGYEGILIAIGESVPFSKSVAVIDRIKVGHQYTCMRAYERASVRACERECEGRFERLGKTPMVRKK